MYDKHYMYRADVHSFILAYMVLLSHCRRDAPTMSMGTSIHLQSSSGILKVAGPPTNEAGASTLPARTTSSVPSTRLSSRILTKMLMALPLLAPRSKVTALRDRV